MLFRLWLLTLWVPLLAVLLRLAALGANEPDDGERVWAVFELCSDLTDDGVCDFMERASAPMRR